MIRALMMVFLIDATAAQAQDVDCTDWQNNGTQSTLNICSYQEYLAADSDLNLAYKLAKSHMQQIVDDIAAGETIGRAGDENGVVTLRDAQRAWIIYRDKSCAAEGHIYSNGSIRPLIVNSCYTRLTRRRTEDLRAAFERH